MSGRSGRGRWVLVLLLLALVTGLVAAPTWVRAAGTSVLTGTVLVHVPGTRAAPGMIGAALALAAAGAALALAGRVGRWLVVTVVLACGVLVLWSAAGVLRDPEPAARQAVAAATGVDHVVAPVSLTAGPWVAVVTGVVVVSAGLVLARSSARWAGPSRRHELSSPSAPRAAGAVGEQLAAVGPVPPPDGVAESSPGAAPAQPVDRVRGTIETRGTERLGPDATGPDPVRPATTEHDMTEPDTIEPSIVETSATGRGATGPDTTDERAAWDALSRGEDPT